MHDSEHWIDFHLKKNLEINKTKKHLVHDRSKGYSRVHISSDTAFLKILKKPSIVQE